MNKTLPMLMFVFCAMFGVYIFFDTLATMPMPQDALTNRFVAVSIVWLIGLCFGGLSTTSAQSVINGR